METLKAGITLQTPTPSPNKRQNKEYLQRSVQRSQPLDVMHETNKSKKEKTHRVEQRTKPS